MADESALKDGNRIPTLLFEKNGEIKRVSNTNPLPVTGMTGSGGPTEVTGVGGGPVQVAGNVGVNGTVPVSGTVGISGTVPVSGTVSLSADPTLTETREQTGPVASFTLVTPAAGKRLLIKGMLVIVENASGYDAGVRMAGGKTLHKVFRSDQQGVYVAANYLGAVNEAVTIFGNGMAAGVRSFFLVNYQEV
jgi:hypothetical protein